MNISVYIVMDMIINITGIILQIVRYMNASIPAKMDI